MNLSFENFFKNKCEKCNQSTPPYDMLSDLISLSPKKNVY